MSWKDFCFDVAGKILDGRVTAQHLDALLTGKEIKRKTKEGRRKR